MHFSCISESLPTTTSAIIPPVAIIVFLEPARVLGPLNIELEPTEVGIVQLVFCCFRFLLIIVLHERKLLFAGGMANPQINSASTEVAEGLFELGDGHSLGDVADEQAHLKREL